MALIAVDAVVYVSVHLWVMEVARVVPAMASRALENGVVVRVDMAGRAYIVRTAMVRWKSRVLGMVERGVRPTRCVVAGLARSGEEL